MVSTGEREGNGIKDGQNGDLEGFFLILFSNVIYSLFFTVGLAICTRSQIWYSIFARSVN